MFFIYVMIVTNRKVDYLLCILLNNVDFKNTYFKLHHIYDNYAYS